VVTTAFPSPEQAPVNKRSESNPNMYCFRITNDTSNWAFMRPK